MVCISATTQNVQNYLLIEHPPPPSFPHLQVHPITHDTAVQLQDRLGVWTLPYFVPPGISIMGECRSNFR